MVSIQIHVPDSKLQTLKSDNDLARLRHLAHRLLW